MSLFSLPQSAAELVSANQGTARAAYRQVTCTRDVTGSNFTNGPQQFRFETGGTTWWVPDRSYISMRITISMVRAIGGPPLPILNFQDIGPAMGVCGNFFKTVEAQLNGKLLQRVSERLPQIDALKTRMSKSWAFMKTLGKSTNFWDSDFNVRHQAISVDGYQSDVVTQGIAYGPSLTQVEAGFDILNSMEYEADTNLVLFNQNAAVPVVNIQFGPEALRPGDLIAPALVAAGPTLQIVTIVSPILAIAKPVGGTAGNTDILDAVAFTVKKIADSQKNDTPHKNSFECVWQPPLGLFDKQHAIPPGGLWNIQFDPETKTDFKKNAVESILAELRQVQPNQVNNAIGDFEVVVEEMYLYLYTVEANRFDNGSWFLDLQNVKVQEENMQQNSTSLSQKNFEVNDKTNAITLAFQDQQAGVTTLRMRSKFKIRPARNLTQPNRAAGLSSQSGQDLMLTRFFIQYNNTQKPQPDSDAQWEERTGDSLSLVKNHMMRRYVDSMMNAGAYHTEGGAESFEDWLSRGPYYHFLWPKDALEQPTRVNLNYQFARSFENLDPGGADSVANHKILLWNHFRSAFHIIHRNGRVEKMSVEAL